MSAENKKRIRQKQAALLELKGEEQLHTLY